MERSLVEMRAGLMVLDDSKLKADPRKGLIRLIIDDQDLVHFQWLERTSTGAAATTTPEVDTILFGGEAVFEKIDRPGSRVFTLKFANEADRNLFFWAQEPNTDSDAPCIDAVNAAMSSVLDGMDEDDVDRTEERPTDPGATTTTTTNTATVSEGIGASHLAAALGSILASASTTTATTTTTTPMTTTALGDVLKAERIIPLLRQNPTLVTRLAPHLPEEHRTCEAMVEIVDSPQFKHQLGVLTQALATGQLSTSEFGLSPPGALGVKEFLDAIQRQAEQEEEEEKKTKNAAASSGGAAADE